MLYYPVDVVLFLATQHLSMHSPAILHWNAFITCLSAGEGSPDKRVFPIRFMILPLHSFYPVTALSLMSLLIQRTASPPPDVWTTRGIPDIPYAGNRKFQPIAAFLISNSRLLPAERGRSS